MSPSRGEMWNSSQIQSHPSLELACKPSSLDLFSTQTLMYTLWAEWFLEISVKIYMNCVIFAHFNDTLNEN